MGTRLGMGDIIGQAETVLMRRYGLEAGDAHALLVHVSEQQSRSLGSVALAVIERLASSVAGGIAAMGR